MHFHSSSHSVGKDIMVIKFSPILTGTAKCSQKASSMQYRRENNKALINKGEYFMIQIFKSKILILIFH